MVLPLLALQLLTIANITIERQAIFESLTHRTHTDQSYDYVVVGAGTAGSVVASRLSENAKHKVLLIESGGEESVESDMPALFGFVFIDKTMDGFHYKTVPQTSSLNREFELIRGKYLGGCSVNNGMKLNQISKITYFTTIYIDLEPIFIIHSKSIRKGQK
jgi:choline dehydrogenase